MRRYVVLAVIMACVFLFASIGLAQRSAPVLPAAENTPETSTVAGTFRLLARVADNTLAGTVTIPQVDQQASLQGTALLLDARTMTRRDVALARSSISVFALSASLAGMERGYLHLTLADRSADNRWDAWYMVDNKAQSVAEMISPQQSLPAAGALPPPASQLAPNLSRGTVPTTPRLAQMRPQAAPARLTGASLLAAGGPDEYGYRYKDSNETHGPVYTWLDISSTGTAVFPHGADEASSSLLIDLAFSFPYYTRVYTQVQIIASGFLELGGDILLYFPTADPDPALPNSYVCIFCTPLHTEEGIDQVYYERMSNPQRFVVQYENASSGLSFEVVLYANGDMLTQYAQVRPERLWSPLVIGTEDDLGLIGLRYPPDAITNSLAISFTRPAAPPAGVDLLIVQQQPLDEVYWMWGYFNEAWWSPVGPGGQADYWVRYINVGDTTAPSVRITDTFPAAAVAISSKLPADQIQGHTYIWDVGNLGPGEQGFFRTSVILSDTVAPGTVLANAIEIGTPLHETSYDHNQSIDAREVVSPVVDLRIWAPYNGLARPGAVADIEIDAAVYHEFSSTAARDVIVTDTLPLSMTFVSASPPPARRSGQDVIWDLGTIMNHAPQVTISLQALISETVSPNDRLTNIVQVSTSSPQRPEELYDNVYTQTIGFWAPIDLAVEKSYGGPAEPGESGGYYISISNTTGYAATNVRITDTVPAVFAIDSVSPGAQVNGQQVVYTVTQMSAYLYEWCCLGIQTRLTDTVPAGTVITNVVHVSAAELDANPANNVFTHTLVTTRTLDLDIYTFPETGLDDLSRVAGHSVTYSVWLNSSGSLDAPHVLVTDTIQSPLVYAGATRPYSYTVGNQYVWDLGTVPAHDHVDFGVLVTVPISVTPGTWVTNSVAVSTDQPETEYGNNERATGTLLLDWKPAAADYAPGGVPDFDQRRNEWVNQDLGAHTWSGPAAAADALWWLDSIHETCLWPPPNKCDTHSLVQSYGTWDDHDASNVVPLAGDLAWRMDTDGARTGAPRYGTDLADLDAALNAYIGAKGLSTTYVITTVTAPAIDWLASPGRRDDGIVLLLGFWEYQTDHWVRLGGHYVTMAGNGWQNPIIALSDPARDCSGPCRVKGSDPYGDHDDAANVTQGEWTLFLFNTPGGSAAVEDYSTYFVVQGQNIPADLAGYSGPWQGDVVTTTVEDAIVIHALSSTPVTPTATSTATRTPTATATATQTPTATATATETPTATRTVAPYEQRVNCGGSLYTDDAGKQWAADQAFTTGSWGYVGGTISGTTATISGTTAQPLYKKERNWNTSAVPGYRFTVPPGQYEVKLKFAETLYNAAGQRKFHVNLEGSRVLGNYDIFAAAGARNIAAPEKTFLVNVTDGELTIDFVQIAGYGNPKVNAIQVRYVGPPQPTPTPTATRTATVTPTATNTAKPTKTRTAMPTSTATSTKKPTKTATKTATATATGTFTPTPTLYVKYVNAGGPRDSEPLGRVWLADKAFAAGSWGYIGPVTTTLTTTMPIGGTSDDVLYQSERNSMSAYEFSVPNGVYSVTLKFAEIKLNAANKRVFDVKLEGAVVLPGLDIWSAAGNARYAAVDYSFTVQVTDKVLNIDFLPRGGAPKISAIAVEQKSRLSTAGPPPGSDHSSSDTSESE